jgi:predicted transcriptional regulator
MHEQITEIAKAERRTTSNILELALESFVVQYSELHPQFRADIVAGLAQLDAGEVVPYQRG